MLIYQTLSDRHVHPVPEKPFHVSIEWGEKVPLSRYRDWAMRHATTGWRTFHTLFFYNLIAAQRSTCFTHFPRNADNSQFKLSDLNETALSLECSRLDCFISAAFFFALCDLTWSNHVLEESARWREKKKMKKFVCHSRWHGHDVNRRAAAVVVFSVDFQLQRSWSLCRPNIAIEINMFSPRRALARSRIFFRLT